MEFHQFSAATLNTWSIRFIMDQISKLPRNFTKSVRNLRIWYYRLIQHGLFQILDIFQMYVKESCRATFRKIFVK